MTKISSTTGSIRLFEIIMYPDSKSYDFYGKINEFESYCESHSYSYWWILHDKEEVKTHCHFLVYCNGSTTTLNKIARDLYLDTNMIEKKTLLTSSLKYLCHISTNSTDKVQYDWHDINTNDITRLKKVYDNLDENSYIRLFINYIDTKDIIYYRDFVNYVLDNNLWSYYRRSASILTLIIKEHNEYIVEKNHCKNQD